MNEDTLETENAAAAAAAAFTASTHLKEAVLGRFSPCRRPSLDPCQLHHPEVPQPCTAAGQEDPAAAVQSCWLALAMLSRGTRNALPGVQGSPASCRGWVAELAAAGWVGAALSWCRMRP